MGKRKDGGTGDLVVLDPTRVTLKQVEGEMGVNRRRRAVHYTPALAQEIADVMAGTVRSVATLCRENDHWPDPITVVRWEQQHDDFRSMMWNARRARADMLMAEVVEIADDASGDMVQIGDNYVPNPVAAARSKIRCDVRLKVAAKLNPAKYGDKLDVSGSVGHYVSQEDAIRQLR